MTGITHQAKDKPEGMRYSHVIMTGGHVSDEESVMSVSQPDQNTSPRSVFVRAKHDDRPPEFGLSVPDTGEEMAENRGATSSRNQILKHGNYRNCF